ncbi:uracil-DNA glycosylase [Tepidimicrobium xylanilyticum]|uniref:Type-4 uracil-DNA glycosylase n=1 Tax=Tepidimicrobium xylanilyticum TaxID=1123352 RepID=A0A1H2XUW6_9FIRM|nr:uracil-DNA glycosylase [Tepidimicrobium xylanilyticum]SDW96752.1 DNA polymerase [Tepidimicrobium xylanilyticum]
MKKDRIKVLNEKIKKNYPNEKIIIGDGNLNSTIMLLGEAPGGKEIEIGKPFVGQAGKHFQEFLDVLNIKREDVYITNSVKYRPTKINARTNRISNRTPTVKEIDDFRDYIYEEISIIMPKIIVTLGNTPLRLIFKNDIKIGEVHGKLMEKEINNRNYKIFPLYHPAAIIYNRDLKDIYMEDLIKLKKELKKLQKRVDFILKRV